MSHFEYVRPRPSRHGGGKIHIRRIGAARTLCGRGFAAIPVDVELKLKVCNQCRTLQQATTQKVKPLFMLDTDPEPPITAVVMIGWAGPVYQHFNDGCWYRAGSSTPMSWFFLKEFSNKILVYPGTEAPWPPSPGEQ